jgi:hypothetical protein
MTEAQRLLSLPWRVVQDCCGGANDGWMVMDNLGKVVYRPRVTGAHTKHVLTAMVEAANRAGLVDGQEG